MSRIYFYIIFVCIALSSCSKKENLGVYWGETKIYDDFLFSKYTPVRIDKTMELDFNSDAKKADAKVHFGLFKNIGDKEGVKLTTSEALLFIDGELADSNEFTVDKNDTSIKISIEVLKGTPDGRNSWLIKTIGYSGLDRIDDIELDNSASGSYALKFYIKKDTVMNDLLFGLIIFAIIVVVFLIIWKLILQRMFYPTFRAGMVTFQIDIYKPVKIKGARMVVCTNKPVKQSALNTFFTGKIIYFTNPFWTKSWTILPKNKNNIKVIGSNFILDPYSLSLSKGVEYTLQNIETNEKIIITYI